MKQFFKQSCPGIMKLLRSGLVRDFQLAHHETRRWCRRHSRTKVNASGHHARRQRFSKRKVSLLGAFKHPARAHASPSRPTSRNTSISAVGSASPAVGHRTE